MTLKKNLPDLTLLLSLLLLSHTLLFPATACSIELIDNELLSCDLSGNVKGFYLGIHDNPFAFGGDRLFHIFHLENESILL